MSLFSCGQLISCCPTKATLPKVHAITTALTSTHGSHASTASPALGLPPAAGAFDDTDTGMPSSPMGVGPTAVAVVAAGVAIVRFAWYCSISRGFQTCTKRITQMSEKSDASTSGNCGPTKLEIANCITANDSPATSATGHAVRKLRAPVNIRSA